jgi:hypothetical protein
MNQFTFKELAMFIHSLSAKSIQGLTLSTIILAGLIGFHSAALAREVRGDLQESTTTQSPQNTSDSIQKATSSDWWCRYPLRC